MNLALAVGLLTALSVYAHLVMRYNSRHAKPFNRWFVAAFVVSGASLFVALGTPLETWADASFLYHMTQHMILVYVAAPLILLSAPIALLLGACNTVYARRWARLLRSVPWRILTFPLCAWIFFMAVMWGAHLSALYETALERPPVHLVEHALFFGSALLFWQSVIHIGPVSWPMNFPLRIVYVLTAMPPSAFLGLALYQTRHVLYQHYIGTQGSVAAALWDQQNGSALMWIAGGLLLFIVFMVLAAMWGYHERRIGARGVLVVLALVAVAMPMGAGANVDEGRKLFAIHCSACHGANMEGSARAPKLTSASRASVDFWLSTGRMPASVPHIQDMHERSLFDALQINQITDFVMSHSRGSQVLPHVDTSGNLGRGRTLFMGNCAACHGATGAGSAIGYGWIAPSLDRATALQLAEAVRTGPGMMPQFDARTLSERDLNDIVRYVRHLQSGAPQIGGVSSAGLGPVAEGLVAWILGMGVLYFVVRVIGSNA